MSRGVADGHRDHGYLLRPRWPTSRITSCFSWVFCAEACGVALWRVSAAKRAVTISIMRWRTVIALTLGMRSPGYEVAGKRSVGPVVKLFTVFAHAVLDRGALTERGRPRAERSHRVSAVCWSVGLLARRPCPDAAGPGAGSAHQLRRRRWRLGRWRRRTRPPRSARPRGSRDVAGAWGTPLGVSGRPSPNHSPERTAGSVTNPLVHPDSITIRRSCDALICSGEDAASRLYRVSHQVPNAPARSPPRPCSTRRSSARSR